MGKSWHSLLAAWLFCASFFAGEARTVRILTIGNSFSRNATNHLDNHALADLGACVWYEVLFGESAVGNIYVPKGMKAAYARFLQETAHKAVQARK